jgi:hypothetical protein
MNPNGRLGSFACTSERIAYTDKTKRTAVRISSAEPNILTSSSAYFWLTGKWRELVRNGQNCGKWVLSESGWYGQDLPNETSSPCFRGTCSPSPQRHARSVNGAIQRREPGSPNEEPEEN